MSTAIDVRQVAGEIEWLTPFGTADLDQFIVRPTPKFASNPKLFEVFSQRQIKKNLSAIWSEIHYELPQFDVEKMDTQLTKKE
ncbi:hypothetical protein Hs30E_16660 [Lactococcus hodotermopsidis]|uniref:Uncharacterized protein n=1 Tax=Pseudolactococcus hodotermopsidis TaxID=2709157 RepID=A0A6A0BEJ9_9LACT|nr:hypothetical protein Hs30E_16660 [Lactococcus hodotermopsidis]